MILMNIQDKTLMLKVNINGSFELFKYNGNSFELYEANYSVEIKALANEGNLCGYQVDVNIPYEVLGLTKDTAKELLTICPILRNSNTDSKLITAK